MYKEKKGIQELKNSGLMDELKEVKFSGINLQKYSTGGSSPQKIADKR